MGFFRLGKLEKAERPSQEGGGDPPGTGSAASSAVGADKIAQPEKGDKKNKGGFKEDPLAGGPSVGHGSAGHSSGERFPSNPATGAKGGVAAATNRSTGLSVNDFISKTKNQQRQGLKPSGPELIAYARYLGIDPVADHDLLWIAVEALEAPLPSDWTEHFDSNDRVFYYNAAMRVSSWTHPLEHIYRETYRTIVDFRNTTISAQERQERISTLQAEVKQMETDVHKEIVQWTEHTDEQGNRFFFNREERQSTWTDPRPAKCQVLYLKMKMLRVLVGSSGAAFANNAGFGAEKASHRGGTSDAGGQTSRSQRDGGGGSVAGGLLSEDEGTSLIDGDTPDNTDSDSEDRRKKKKKKKKHKKDKKDKERKEKDKDKLSEAEGPAMTAAGSSMAPPLRPGTQNLRNSQSEPSVGGVGGKPGMHSNVEEVRGGMGGGMQASSLALGTFEAEGFSNAGRAKVKAGIRLEPLSGGGGLGGGGGGAPPAGGGAAGGGGAGGGSGGGGSGGAQGEALPTTTSNGGAPNTAPPQGGLVPKGTHGSASVPSL